MDGGIIVLVVGAAAIFGISKIPHDWLKTAGGLLIILTLALVVIDVVRSLFG